jgi:hypothetical protein
VYLVVERALWCAVAFYMRFLGGALSDLFIDNLMEVRVSSFLGDFAIWNQ